MFGFSSKSFFAFLSLFSAYAQDSRIYNFQSQKCCEGQVHNVPEAQNNRDYACCGTDMYQIKPYNDSADLKPRCCRGTLYTQLNKTTQCCGREVYQVGKQICYQTGVLGADDEFGVMTFSPDDIQTGKTSACVKSKDDVTLYNFKKEMCCFGVVHTIEDNMVCCGKEYINTTVSKCCDEYVKDEETNQLQLMKYAIQHNGDIPKRSACCNGGIIDAGIQMCCESVAFDLPENITSGFYSFCCGAQLVTDRNRNLCMDRKPKIKRGRWDQVFCGEQWHNISGDEPLSVYCINDTVLQLKLNEAICSVNENNEIYDTTESVCGANQVVPRTPDDVENNRTAFCWKSSERSIMMKSFVQPVLFYRPPSNDSQFHFHVRIKSKGKNE